MDKEKAYKVAEMYKNAAENEKDSKKAGNYFKKAANYYIKLNDVENTITCLNKVGLLESNFNLLLQKLNPVEVVEYFQANNQTTNQSNKQAIKQSISKAAADATVE